MKKAKLFLMAIIMIAGYSLTAQVAVTTDGSSADASAMLDVKSNNAGFLVPRMTATEMSNISSPATGLMVFNTTANAFYFYDGNSWSPINSNDGDWTVNGNDMYSTVTGNVGIGTTSPTSKLHLSGGDGQSFFSKATIALGFSNSGNYAHFIHTRHNSGSVNNNAIDFYTSDGTAAGVFPTNAVHGLTIVAGKVGIGTTGPVNNLDVVGNFGIRGTGLNGSATQRFVLYADTSYGLYFDAPKRPNGSRLPIAFNWRGGGTVGLYISGGSSYGNVGIGTNNPLAKLDVRGNAYVTTSGSSGGVKFGLNNTGTGGINYTMISTNNNHASLGGGDFAILDESLGGTDANKTRLLLTNTGNFGIGTTNPGEKLDINGAMHLTPGSAPTTANEGDIYMDASTHKLRCFDGTTWHDLW